MKLGRQSVIMEIINERDIETQNQLMDALAERGVKSTQATLSRDIRAASSFMPSTTIRLLRQMDTTRISFWEG